MRGGQQIHEQKLSVSTEKPFVFKLLFAVVVVHISLTMVSLRCDKSPSDLSLYAGFNLCGEEEEEEEEALLRSSLPSGTVI